MKKLLVIFFSIGLYLYLSYVYFYNFLEQHHLTAPVHETKIIIGSHPENQTIKYVSLGDSLTAGVGVSDYKSSYPYLLARKLSVRENVELINFSHAGDTSTEVLISQLPQALAAKPDLITLLIGVNDIHNLKSLADFKSNFVKIVTTLKNSGAKIYILSIPYLGSDKVVYFPYNLFLDFRTKQFNQVIQQVASNSGVFYIDLYSINKTSLLLRNKSADFYSLDQFHPGREGYQEWAETLNVN